MTRGPAIALLLLAGAAALGSCQTFQYSRGWGPGKRAEEPMLGLLVRCLQAIGAAPEAPEVQGRVAAHLLEALERCRANEGY